MSRDCFTGQHHTYKGLKGMTEIAERISERKPPQLLDVEFLDPRIWQLRDEPYCLSILPPDGSEPHLLRHVSSGSVLLLIYLSD